MQTWKSVKKLWNCNVINYHMNCRFGRRKIAWCHRRRRRCAAVIEYYYILKYITIRVKKIWLSTMRNIIVFYRNAGLTSRRRPSVHRPTLYTLTTIILLLLLLYIYINANSNNYLHAFHNNNWPLPRTQLT